MNFPEMPPQLRTLLPEMFWNWWQAMRTYLLSNLFTQSDITVITKGKGVVLTNAAGTVTRRVRLNDAGDGIIIEAL